MKRSGILLISIMLFSLAIGAVSAQMGNVQMGNTATRGGMGGVDAFGNMDNRFMGFSSKTLSQVCNEFGVSAGTAISDMGLPANLNRQMTIAQIEAQYEIKGDDIANYMAIHMHQTTASVNARQMAVMRQQAAYGKRSQGVVQGLHFMREGSSAYGQYVTYSFDKTGIVRDFAVSGDAIFDSIQVPEFGYTDENVRGSSALYVGKSAIFSLHDNPNAITQVMALEDISVAFDLAEGVEANLITDEETGTTTVKITKNNFEGYLILCGDCLRNEVDTNDLDIEVRDGTIKAELVKYSKVIFRATPMDPQYIQTQYRYSERASYMHQRINQEIARGRVGAEVSIRNRGDTSSLLNYTPVNLQLREAVRNRVVLGVASELEEGQVITINLDNETIDLTRPERIRLRYDGQLLTFADNIDELFAGGSRPLCYMILDNETASMAVYIPEFSEHEIIIYVEPEPTETETEIETEAPTETEDSAPMPALGIVFATAALAVAYARCRR
jgi:MAST domain-containing protein